MEADFKNVVRRIYEIAKDHYDNDIQQHIQAIYNRLSDGEQNVFLKSLIPFIFDVEKPPKSVRESVHLEYDEFDIHVYNQIEMIKLKSWIVKCGLLLFSSISVLFSGHLLIKALLPDQSPGLFADVFEILKFMWGN